MTTKMQAGEPARINWMSPSLRSFTLLFLLGSTVSCTVETSRKPSLEQDWDVAVVGGGLMGSSTAWQLARAGQKVLLLEKQDAAYTEGSSRGAARIARSLGPPGDVWSSMHNRTVSEVEGLVGFLNEHGESLEMDAIYTTSPVTYVRHESRFPSYAYLPDQDDRYELATTPNEARELFGLTVPDDVFVVREFKEHSGTIDPTATIQWLHRGIEAAGGRVVYGREVVRLERSASGYELEIVDVAMSGRTPLVVPKVVSAAGPYTGRLLEHVAPEFEQLVSPERVFLAFFKVDAAFWRALPAEDRARLESLFPAINSVVPTRDGSSFSMIEGRGADGQPVLKIGGHFQRSEIEDLDAVWSLSLSEDEIDWAQTSLLRHLSLLDLELGPEQLRFVRGTSCVYSLTADEVPYVTEAVGADGQPDSTLVILAGLSGVGAKGSLAYGLLAANLVLGRTATDTDDPAAREKFGFERLLRDLEILKGDTPESQR